jgi:hypothetical protein
MIDKIVAALGAAHHGRGAGPSSDQAGAGPTHGYALRGRGDRGLATSGVGVIADVTFTRDTSAFDPLLDIRKWRRLRLVSGAEPTCFGQAAEVGC